MVGKEATLAAFAYAAELSKVFSTPIEKINQSHIAQKYQQAMDRVANDRVGILLAAAKKHDLQALRNKSLAGRAKIGGKQDLAIEYERRVIMHENKAFNNRKLAELRY